MKKLCLFGAMLFLLAACTQNEVKSPKSLQFSAAEKQMVNECNAFSFNLLAQVATTEEQENVVLSPLSASMLLGMLMNGADGETLAQMQAVTGFGAEASLEDINAYYKQLIEALPNLDAYTNVGIADGIWVKEEFPVYETFMQACKQNFNAQAKNVPTFVDDKVLKDINDFAAQHTNNRIKEIINRGMVSEETMMVLLNALYFKALWAEKFEKEGTIEYTFTTLNEAKIKVEMMRQNENQLYCETEDCQLVELPYKGDQYVADIILPAKGLDIREWVKTLDAERWQQLIKGIYSTEVNLGLPKFSLSYERELTEDLAALGMPAAFTPFADFSRLSELPTYISIIKQKTFLQVDEEGTEAAAVTIGVDVAPSAEPSPIKEFIADRPCLFVIRDRSYGTILFTAIIGHPEWQK